MNMSWNPRDVVSKINTMRMTQKLPEYPVAAFHNTSQLLSPGLSFKSGNLTSFINVFAKT